MLNLKREWACYNSKEYVLMSCRTKAITTKTKTMKAITFFICCIFISLIGISQSTQTKPQKEAVLIVGDRAPADNKARMEELAVILEAAKYKVHRFYSPNNKWADIKKAALNASFFIYNGHGTTLGLNEGFGGLVINEFISAQRIVDELKFNRNPVVIYQSACGAAGTSEGDPLDIGVKEAALRVAETAKPFLMIGASAYYADNYYGGVNGFLELFLSGRPLGEVYLEIASEWTNIEVNRTLNDAELASNLYLGVSSTGGGKKEVIKQVNGKQVKKYEQQEKKYSIAFIGPNELTVNDVLLVTSR